MTDLIRYTNRDETFVEIQPEGYLVNYPGSRYDYLVNDWIGLGNTIEPYTEYYGWTVDQAQNIKKEECDSYANNLIEQANANPQVGVITDATSNERRADSRRKNNADKQAGEIPLDQSDKDQAKTDQKLSEYETKVYADSDKAITNMLKLATAEEIYNFSVSSQFWTIWSPPL